MITSLSLTLAANISVDHRGIPKYHGTLSSVLTSNLSNFILKPWTDLLLFTLFTKLEIKSLTEGAWMV